MHTFGETGVPAFLAKLWRLVDDPETNNLICWSKDGRSFIIQNQAQFARELLPLNYKHNNMASFIRQLNMYGFHKITSIDNGGLKFDRDEMEFCHPCFKRNCPYLLEHIKRKISNTKTNDEKALLKPEAVSKVLQDVKAMRGRQDSLDSRFSLMKQENEALWREIASLRQKHAKQQQIVNKLIQFLITIVSPSRNMSGVKRHMQLMINDSPENANFRKISESESECGPVIHELGEELLDEVADADSELMDPISPYARNIVTHADTESPSPHMERPQSSISISSQNNEYSNLSAEDAHAAAAQGNVAAMGSSFMQRNASPHGVAAGPVPPPGSALIQAVNPDGSKIVYHVTEVLDAHPNEGDAAGNAAATAAAAAAGGQTPSYNEDNVLTTPLVREQMARTQMLKQKNKQRRQRIANTPSPLSENPYGAIGSKMMCLSPQPQKQQQQQQQQQQLQQLQKQQQQQQSTNQMDEMTAVKTEPNLDQMLFLNTYDDSRGLTSDPRLISPNLSEDSIQSGISSVPLKDSPVLWNSGTNDSNAALQAQRNMSRATPTNMYNTGDFITENMPNDLFDDSSILSGNNDNSNFSDTFKTTEQQSQSQSQSQPQRQQQFVPANSAAAGAIAVAAKEGKLSSFIAGNNTNNNGNGNGNANANKAAVLNKNASDLAVTKYKNSGFAEQPSNTMRNEVHGHLDSVQDELESLKELLRGDDYSLDSSTLMNNGQSNGGATNNNNGYYTVDTDFINKFDQSEAQSNCNDALQSMDIAIINKLFNDSEILGPYGLSVYGDLPNSSNGKKGSELATYQPVYDLSDILDKSDLEAAAAASDTNSMNAPSTSRQLPLPTSNASVLNTPYHE